MKISKAFDLSPLLHCMISWSKLRVFGFSGFGYRDWLHGRDCLWSSVRVLAKRMVTNDDVLVVVG